VRKDQLDQLTDLQVVDAPFPMHTCCRGDWSDEIIGPDLAPQISPIKTALNTGLTVSSER
jgi:predicted amidohydrolase YtcJ